MDQNLIQDALNAGLLVDKGGVMAGTGGDGALGVMRHADLLVRLHASLTEYTENCEIRDRDNPLMISLNEREIRLILKNVTSTSRGKPDESRIQVSSKHHRILKAIFDEGGSIAILGYHADTDVFVCWDPKFFARPRGGLQIFSEYSRFSVQTRARAIGISVYTDNDGQNIVSLRPEYLGAYLENIALFHREPEGKLVSVIDQVPVEKSEQKVEVPVPGTREKVVVTRKQYPRDPKFSKRVKKAYENKCAFCRIQLELVEAAHIVPHGKEESSDDVTNGILLCPLHHEAFDRGLLEVSASYTIGVHATRKRDLIRRGVAGGIEQLDQLSGKKIHLPTNVAEQPAKEYLVQRRKYY